jgi:hypothetical protein
MSDEAARTPGDEGPVKTSSLSDHQPSGISSTTSPSLKASGRGWLSGVRRPKTSPGPKTSPFKSTLLSDDDARRDSALASSNSTASTDQAHNHAPSSLPSLRQTPSLPAIVVQDELASRSSSQTKRQSQAHGEPSEESRDNFTGIDTFIPTGDFDDLTSPNQVSFSKRGSMLLGGKRANNMAKQLGLNSDGEHVSRANQQKELSVPASPHLTPRAPSRVSARGRVVSNRVLSTDEMMLSRKVRSMYKHGTEEAVDCEPEEEAGSAQNSFLGSSSLACTPANGSSLTVDRSREDASSIMSSRRGSDIAKEPTETAGGVEDWADLEGGEVDRYGFIVPKKTGSRGSSNGVLDGPAEPKMQRVSTALQLASEEPRKRRIGRSASRAPSSRQANPRAFSIRRKPSHRSSRAVGGSVLSSTTTKTRHTSQGPLRQAANRLPHNKDRRLMDEASDMLKLPPGLAEIAEQEEGGKAALAMKTKEIEREEKWRKMAKVVESSAQGGGMMFEFDVKDPKVISRTWKGIPDRWRGTAWYAFLAASAKASKDSPTDEELVESFYELQEENSPDDMQIDVDVPRTINRHIMFRRRYRGG